MSKTDYERERDEAANKCRVEYYAIAEDEDKKYIMLDPVFSGFCNGADWANARAQAEINKEPIAIAHIKACQRNEEYLDKIDRLTALLRECKDVINLFNAEGYPYQHEVEDALKKLRKELGECICGEINARHCPVHQEGDK